MRLAIREARKAMGNVSPNPPVGCVIVDRDHRFLSSGFTQPPGRNHAEIEALKNLPEGADLSGGHFYVTLEPCAHEGRTPSCAKALAKLPIASLTYGLQDPNPKVNGQGLEILRQSGIQVKKEENFGPELHRLAEIFFHNQTCRAPFVSLKIATSLDGRIGMKTGESKWITGERARRHAHYIRSLHDAILIGANTFLQDDPALNIRHGRFAGKEMKIVVLDPAGRALGRLKDSQLLKAHRPENIFWVGRSLPSEHGSDVNLVSVTEGRSGLNLDRVLAALYDRGIHSLMVEGGARTVSHFLEQKKAHRIYQYMAPVLIGGEGRSFTEYLKIKNFAGRIRMSHALTKKLGADLFFTAKLVHEADTETIS